MNRNGIAIGYRRIDCLRKTKFKHGKQPEVALANEQDTCPGGSGHGVGKVQSPSGKRTAMDLTAFSPELP